MSDFPNWMYDDAPKTNKGKDKDTPYFGEKPAPRAFSSLSDIDLNQELAHQIAEATSFRDHVLSNSSAYQPNHVTDTIKTVNSLISQAVKLQETVQNMQRMKAFEDAMVETLKEFPETMRTAFFAKLKENLK